MRKKRLILNTGTAILNQIIALAFGLIVPRLIISHYGSNVNGLVSSITQFMAFFSLLEMGVGGVVRASLYKPLAERDMTRISEVMISARRFFEKIALLMIVYTVILMIAFPAFINRQIGVASTVVLVIAISLSYISQYMFGIVNQLLLTADQKAYIQMTISCIIILLNTLFSVVLIELGAPIEVMKLVSSLILLLRPLMLKIYVSKNYSIDYKLKLTEEPLKQKWNALTHNIAYYITKHADTVILTLFSSLENVSIYYVYSLVTHSLQQMIELITTGMGALLGDMYAREENEKLFRTFLAFEWIIHSMVTIIYTIAGIMIIPFVKVYTNNINDADYIVPLFSALLVLAGASYAIRLPYNTMVQSAGQFKQTQTSAIIEAVLNVVISVALVWKWGLVGVAIGTLIAMSYRTAYLAWYLKKHILYHPLSIFIGHLVIDISIAIVGIAMTWKINLGNITYVHWIIMSMKVTVIVLIVSLAFNILFYRKEFKEGFKLIMKKNRKM